MFHPWNQFLLQHLLSSRTVSGIDEHVAKLASKVFFIFILFVAAILLCGSTGIGCAMGMVYATFCRYGRLALLELCIHSMSVIILLVVMYK